MNTKSQSGFTLVELIVVIVILGILAATALPRFINTATDARIASMNGAAGALRSAVALAQSRYVATGNMTATSVSMGVGSATQSVTVIAGTGIPMASSAGIQAALQDSTSYTFSCTGTNTAGGNSCTVSPVVGPATCAITYTDAQGTVATGGLTTANCGG